MKSVIQLWLLSLLLAFYASRLAQGWEMKRHIPLSKLLPYSLQRYETLGGFDINELKDDSQNFLETESKNFEKEKRNNEVVDIGDSNLNSNDEFEKHMNLVLQHVAKKLREIYITPRLGRDIEDNIECQRSRPPFAPRLGKKSAPLTPRMGRQVYDDKC